MAIVRRLHAEIKGPWISNFNQLRVHVVVCLKPEHKYRFSTTVLDVCVCVFSSHPFWTSSSLDVPAGVTQEEGHTGFLIHLPSAVRALLFVARRIQPFLSLVDREVEFCVLTNYRSPPVGHFVFVLFLVFSEKNSVCRDRTHVPTCQKVTRCLLSYRGRPADVLRYFRYPL